MILHSFAFGRFRCRLGTGSSKHIQTCHLQEQEVLALLMPNQQLDESTGLESTACHSPSVKHPQKPYFSRGLTNIRDHIMGVFLIWGGFCITSAVFAYGYFLVRECWVLYAETNDGLGCFPLPWELHMLMIWRQSRCNQVADVKHDGF